MEETSFTVQWVRDEAREMRLLSLDGGKVWSLIPGQVAVLKVEGVGESYFAIASAPEDRDGMEFLIRKGKGVSGVLYEAKKGDRVLAKGPAGRGFPIDRYRGRDLFLAAVGSAIAPMRSVLRSIGHRRADFGKVTLVYGVRQADEVPFLGEMEGWRREGIAVIVTLSRPEPGQWNGKVGHVQAHFKEALQGLRQPVALVCGMPAMVDEGKAELVRLGIKSEEILTNY